MAKNIDLGAASLTVANHDPIDNVTPVTISENPSRRSLAIMNTDDADNLLVRIVDKAGVVTADLILLPGQLYEPLVIFSNEVRLIAETANPVSATVMEG